jgi:hypothetical protein
MSVIDTYRKYKVPILIGAGVLAAGLIIWKRKAIWYYIKLPIKMATDYMNSLKIEMLNEVAKPVFRQFIDKLKQAGYDVTITSGYRSYASGKALADKMGLAKAPIINYHLFGIAIDINASKDGKRYMSTTPKADWIASGIPKIATDLNIRWGGLFTTGYGAEGDKIHFDIANKYSVETIKKLATAQLGADQSKWGNNVKLT